MPGKHTKNSAVVLFASPHPAGYTAKLLQDFIKEIEAEYEITILNVYENPVAPCTACSYCEKQDGCPNPDFDPIDTALRTADLLVVACPIYNLSFPAPLKSAFDRMQRYFSARFCRNIRPPIAKHKRAVMLLTCGADCQDGVEIIRRQLTMTFTVINATLEAEIVWKQTDQHPSEHGLTSQIQQAAAKFCRN